MDELLERAADVSGKRVPRRGEAAFCRSTGADSLLHLSLSEYYSTSHHLPTEIISRSSLPKVGSSLLVAFSAF